ncbi:uncharacterized protein LOC112518988 [Cynara cardunculus var. scolymus]|uniref:uncharacterized protein LOC112518988 n=1 Tax=Cynara cardunculus var. scolymus TaxID=59895 RepID=UPI000D63015E|nr:uncharacterized protein LOC112518988 [Cynara cardunculus var. scolymus]
MDYSFPCGLWPPNLRGLAIGCLNKPMSKWGIQNYPTSLVHLNLSGENSGVVSFVANAKDVTSTSFLLPPSLMNLSFSNFMEVELASEVLQRLPCLKTLNIWSCPKLKDLRETNTTGPSSLIISEILDVDVNYLIMVELVSEVLQRLPCLKKLNIWSCPKLEDLRETNTTGPSSVRIEVIQ